MDTYVLQRCVSTPRGTPGELFNPDGSHLCYTVERPWLDNAPDTSSIPAGTYTCGPHVSPKFPGGVWEVMSVSNRVGILIHNANDMLELEGCIAVGDVRGMFGEYPAVLHSVATVAMLKGIFPDNFLLEIRNG